MEIVELPPSCTWCEEFRYKQGADQLYRCKVQCIKTNDLFEMFEDCPYLEKKYGVIEDPKEPKDSEDLEGGD